MGRISSGAVQVLVCLVLILAGAVAGAADLPDLRDGLWAAGGLLGLAVAVVDIARALRERIGGVDVLAALALLGTLAVGEYLAGALVALMLSSGAWLEQRAQARATRELRLLADRAPAHARRVEAGQVRVIDADQVRAGDELLLASGDIVPADGRLLGAGTFDESALSGEAGPVERPEGDRVRSGVVNSGPPVHMLATAAAMDSTYAGVIRLVAKARAGAAPFVRLADRLAVWFVPLALLVAAAAWLRAGDPDAAVAVLVVATPCPLLLAVPIAVMSGISQCARRGVVVKGGAALEQLAAGRVLLLDKTGTLTGGHPVLDSVTTAPDWSADDALALAASVDQMSPHVLATTVVAHARARGLELQVPTDGHETPGAGIRATLDGRTVRVGRAGWVLGEQVPDWARRALRRAELDGSLTAFISVDGQPVAGLLFTDRLRPDAPRMLRTLRSVGVEHVILVTGDRNDLAESVGRLVGVDEVHAEQTPAGKVAVVRAARERGPTIMAGDGINDAPGLAAADVGVALAARGATASSEAADVVLTVDRIDALADALLLSQRSMSIARQSAWLGMGLSMAAMVVAALGYLPATAGALLQEGIDVLAILWALRAGIPHRAASVPLPPASAELVARMAAEHMAVLPLVERIREVADDLDARPQAPGGVAEVRAPVEALMAEIDAVLLPHERAEEHELLPVMASALGGYDPLGALSRSHAEIELYAAQLHRMLEGEVSRDDHIAELRRCLYGLYGILRLHNAQEEEGLFALVTRP